MSKSQSNSTNHASTTPLPFECTKSTGIRWTGNLAGESLRGLYRGPERKASLRINCTPWPNPSTHVSSSSSHSHHDHDNRSDKSTTPSESVQIEERRLVVSRIDLSTHQSSHQTPSASQQASRRHAAKASNSITTKSRFPATHIPVALLNCKSPRSSLIDYVQISRLQNFSMT